MTTESLPHSPLLNNTMLSEGPNLDTVTVLKNPVDNGTLPMSTYMKSVVQRLDTAELGKTCLLVCPLVDYAESYNIDRLVIEV